MEKIDVDQNGGKQVLFRVSLVKTLSPVHHRLRAHVLRKAAAHHDRRRTVWQMR